MESVEVMGTSFDQLHFYLKGKPIYPRIKEGGGAAAEGVMIDLLARASDDLEWKPSLDQARMLLQDQDSLQVIWVLDFGIETTFFSAAEDQMLFYTFVLALETFCNIVWPEFKERTLGVVLYRGQGTQSVEEAEVLGKLLHRLASFLPDSVAPLAILEHAQETLSLAQLAMMYSKRRFGPVGLMLKGGEWPFFNWQWDSQLPGFIWCDGANKGVCLPSDPMCDPFFLQELNLCLKALLQEGTAFRIVSEEFLTEEWNGLDTLIAFPSKISLSGQRKLQGFEATGGEIIFWGV